MTPAASRRFSPNVSTGSERASQRREIPFDYAFRYTLEGKPNNVLNSIVTVSVEATFTAVSIGYGVVPKVDPIIFGLSSETNRIFGSITMAEIIGSLDNQLSASSRGPTLASGSAAVLKNGIKLNPSIADLALQKPVPGRGFPELSTDVLSRLFQIVGAPPELIQFKYALFDEGSGREFQSEPILNIAGLGSAGGERPFRYFAQPIVFRPRSTIRMEVTEVSDFAGELHVSLHGYKVLGGSDTPTAVAQRSTPGRR
jgi:hypothetical protein